MSTYYYLFKPSSKEYINLGKKVIQKNRDYEGPTIMIDGTKYYLPPYILNNLFTRFCLGKMVILLPEYDLFDNSDYWENDEDLGTAIGGDKDSDPPLTRYLPELETEEIQKEIMSYPELKIE